MWPARYLAAVLAVAGTLAGIPLVAQQATYTADDIEEGGRMFFANCATCHGADGEAVPGVDLGHGQFRRAASDDDLADIIRRGIQGTAMPPSTFSNVQTGQIVAYLRSLAVTSENAAVPGDAARGKALFDGKGQCLGCHRVSGTGSRLGPDLSDVGQFRRATDLRRALVEPGASVRPQNRVVRVVTRDGAAVTGKLLNHDSFTLLLIDSNERLRSFLKSNLREFAISEPPSMPSLRGTMSAAEIDDLIRYLVSLKGIKAITP